MRAAWVFVVVALLSACSREPDFDERYQAAAKHIHKTADEIDKEIAQREQARQTGTPAPQSTHSSQR